MSERKIDRFTYYETLGLLLKSLGHEPKELLGATFNADGTYTVKRLIKEGHRITRPVTFTEEHYKAFDGPVIPDE